MRAPLVASLALALAAGCSGGGGGGGSSSSASTSTSGTGTTGGTGTSAGTIGEPITTSTGYIALVEDGLEASVLPLLQGYQARGVNVALVSLSHVTAPGRDRAEQIRAWLIANADDGVRRPLLLVGGAAAIPFRTCTPAASAGDVVSDLYYGELHGDWDANGNGVFGELAGDAPLFDAQLRVGRIPFDDAATVAAAVAAIEAARTNRGAWSSGCLLPAATIITPGDAPFAAEAVKSASFVPDGWTVESAYPAPSPIHGDDALDPSTIVTRLDAAPRALIFAICHGNESALASHEASGFIDFFTEADLALLPKDRPPVLVAAACDSGDPSGGPCLGSLALASGLAGYVGATVVVDPLSGGGAGLEAEFQIAKEIAAGTPLGEALCDTIRDYAHAGIAATQGQADARAEVYHEAMGGIMYGDPGMALGPKAP